MASKRAIGAAMEGQAEAAAPVAIVVGVDDDAADDEEIEELTAKLRRELLALDDVSVDRPRVEDVPEGAKALDAATIGHLLVTVSGHVSAASAVVAVLQGWLSRDSRRMLRIEGRDGVIELSAATPEQQQALVEQWIASQQAAPS